MNARMISETATISDECVSIYMEKAFPSGVGDDSPLIRRMRTLLCFREDDCECRGDNLVPFSSLPGSAIVLRAELSCRQ